jgi:hypothetical protein
MHEDSGEKRTTGMFYNGHNTWKFRFTATRTGTWIFSTSSQDPDLDGKQGTVTIGPNPNKNLPGFITSFGNKWYRTGTGKAFVPQLAMYAGPKHFYRHPQRIDAAIKTLLVEHGFNGLHVMGNCYWLDMDKQSYDQIRQPDPNPDRRIFEAFELLITRVHAAGGMVHIWMWGDEQRHWTPKKWGINGPVDRRLQRYIAARMGPLPGWTMGYGFDLQEWVSEKDLRGWHAYLHKQFAWPHMLGARWPILDQQYEGLDYWGYQQHRPDYEMYVKTIERRGDRPSFSEDRFRIRDPSPYPKKDYDEELTRRGLWHSAMAGGVANIWGHLPRGHDGTLGSAPYRHPEWIKTCSTFFEDRFLKSMARDNSITDGVCLKTPRATHYVFYKEATRSIKMNLSEMTKARRGIAVDTRKAYREIPLGRLAAEKQTWKAPHRSDWAIAVGQFSGPIRSKQAASATDQWRE